MEGTFCVLDEAFWPCNWPPAWLFMPCGLLVGAAADLAAVADGGEVVDVLPESLLWVLLNVDSGSAKRALCLEVVWVRGEPVFLSAVGDVGESSLVRFFFRNPSVGIEPSSLLRRFRGRREAEDTTVGGGGWTVWACRGLLNEAISQGRARVRERGRLPGGDQSLIDRCFYAPKRLALSDVVYDLPGAVVSGGAWYVCDRFGKLCDVSARWRGVLYIQVKDGRPHKPSRLSSLVPMAW